MKIFENFNFVDETLIVYIQCFVTNNLVESSTVSVSELELSEHQGGTKSIIQSRSCFPRFVFSVNANKTKRSGLITENYRLGLENLLVL